MNNGLVCTKRATVECATAKVVISTWFDPASGTGGHEVELKRTCCNTPCYLWFDTAEELNALASAIEMLLHDDPAEE